MKNNRKNSIRKAHAPVPTTRVSHHFLQYSILHPCADLEGGSGGSGPPLEFVKLDIADITRNEKKLFFLFVHFHSYTSNRINPQNNNQTRRDLVAHNE